MTRLRIRVKNSMYERRDRFAYPIAEYNEYEGEVAPKPKWVGEDSFCLTTGDAKFPFRVLSKDDILCGWEMPNTQPNSIGSRSFKVKQYVVTEQNNRWSCSCVGFGYRKKCSHIDIARAA